MSTENSNIVMNNYSKEELMVKLCDVAYFRWDADKGARLKQLRGKITRRSLAEKLKNSEHKCSHQYIQTLETGKANSVGRDLMLAVCEAIGADIGEILTTVKISTPK